MEPSFRGPGAAWAGGPSERQKNYASNLHEQDSLISSYEHLTGLPTPPEALMRLRKIASLVKPIMRKRSWHVHTLTEFLPEDPRLLGLNINHGHKICIRLRFSHNPATFLPIEQCVDTMLHELSHIVFGPHDASFHALWDELRSEHETLLFRGFTGEGFLTKGHRLGGHMPPPQELRRLARQNAENSRKLQKGKSPFGGFKLGGKRILPGQDPRKVIADAIDQRNTISRGCASGSVEADKLARQNSRSTIKTKSGDDDANDRAIAEAMLELMEEEEMQRLGQAEGDLSSQGLAWNPEAGLYSVSGRPSRPGRSPPLAKNLSEEEQMKWAIEQSMKALPPLPPEATNDSGPSGSNLGSDPIARPGSAPLPNSINSDGYPSKRPRGVTRNVSYTAGSQGNLAPLTESPQRPPYRTGYSASDLATAISAASAPTWKVGAPRIRRKPTNPDREATVAPTPPPPPTSAPPAPSSVGRDLPPTLRINPPVQHQTPPPPPYDSHPTAYGWTCDVCTCINPPAYLTCDACGLERTPASISASPFSSHVPTSATVLRGPLTAAENLDRVGRRAAVLQRPDTMGWSCRRCSTFMEHKYWTCSVCGLMKGDSRANEHVL